MKYRDPETGEFKDITVKVSDTLPIGAEVDYDGTTIPNGWEQVEDVNKIERVLASSIISLNSGYSFLEETTLPIYKQGKHYWGDIIIKTSNVFNNLQQNLGSFKINLQGTINSFCSVSNDEYRSNVIAYTYYEKAHIYVADHSNSQSNIVKIHLDFMIS